MSESNLAIVVLAAGKGQRMRVARAKVLHEVAGKAMLHHVLAAGEPLQPAGVVVVVGPEMAAVEAAAAPHRTVVQERPLGTGHAVLAAEAAVREILGPDLDGEVMVLFGDSPLMTSETLQAMLAARQELAAPPLVALAFTAADPAAYGRMVLDASGRLARVVEAADADAETLKVTLCNGGVMLGQAAALFGYLGQVGNDNPKSEYYQTEVFALAAADGEPARIVQGSEEEIQGVNSQAQLAQAEAAMQRRLRHLAMDGGVTLIDPEAVWFSADTDLAAGVVVEPGVFFGPGVTVAAGARIRAFSHLEQVSIGAEAMIGPFARLRGGAEIGEKVRIGNFVEIKNARYGPGAKTAHLTYVGDAEVGAGANIGAGTITCNYDGVSKHRTTIGKGAFIGSNSALVAPLTVGEGAIVGAGSTITRDVPDGALAVARGRQDNKPGFAQRLRQALQKAAKKKG